MAQLCLNRIALVMPQTRRAMALRRLWACWVARAMSLASTKGPRRSAARCDASSCVYTTGEILWLPVLARQPGLLPAFLCSCDPARGYHKHLHDRVWSSHTSQIEELIQERDKARAEASELKQKIQSMEENSVDKTIVQRLENKVRELETKLDFEMSNKHRLEVQVNRMKEQLDRLTEEKDQAVASKTSTEETHKKTQRQLRDLREEFSDVQKKELEFGQKSKENETRVNELEADYEQSQSDLKLAFKRIADLQAALEDGIDSDEELSDR